MDALTNDESRMLSMQSDRIILEIPPKRRDGKSKSLQNPGDVGAQMWAKWGHTPAVSGTPEKGDGNQSGCIIPAVLGAQVWNQNG